MVRFVRAPLTRVGFRRDVRLFLGLLVGFLAVLIALLIVILQTFLQHTSEVIWAGWEAAADSAVRDLAVASRSDPGNARGLVPLLQSRYGIAGVVIEPLHKRPETIGVPATAANVQAIRRSIATGSVVFVFDASELRARTQTFWATALISLLASTGGVVLLMLYLPRITAPIEAMLDSAASIKERAPSDDEQVYLINTFRSAIEQLKAQEAELQRLHRIEKMRADDLERVTAALTRSLTSGFLSVDPSGRIVDLNGMAREILRPPGGDAKLAGIPLAEAFIPSEFLSALETARTSRVAITRAEVSTGGEEARVAGLTTVPLFGEGSDYLGMLALFTDLTPLRRLESRLRDLQSLADLGEISAGIAHEFRNSLSTILGYLRLVRNAELPEAAARSAGNAEREASLLAGAVEALLVYGRPMKLDSRPTDIFELLKEVISRIATQHNVPIECMGEQAVVNADATVLARAFENLIRNAVESVEENREGQVKVHVENGERIAVRIEDSGVGLSDADVSRLFLPFQSDKRGGYGIGLPLVKKIILLHEGEIHLSGTPGRGATAVVELPAARQTPQ